MGTRVMNNVAMGAASSVVVQILGEDLRDIAAHAIGASAPQTAGDAKNDDGVQSPS